MMVGMTTWTRTRITGTVVSAVILGGLAFAIAVDGATSEKGAVTDVESAPPVVVSTVPRAGSNDVDARAVTELKVTFSKDMEPKNFSWVQYSEDTFPKTAGTPHFLDDRRTCVLPVKLEPGHPYVIWLNKAPHENFMDGGGRKAVPYLLVFETKN